MIVGKVSCIFIQKNEKSFDRRKKLLDRHNEDSYKKLENINLELAELARDHHYYSDDIYMQRFQELDDK